MIPDFFIEHCQDFIKGVSSYFADKDVRLFISQTKFNTTHESLFDFQYWSSAEILKSKQIDAYIFLSGVYCSIIPEDKFCEIIGSYNDRPIISASIDLSYLSNCYSVINDSKKIYSQIVGHLKNVHDCKKIAFMSANDTSSSEAFERFECFKAALAEHEIPFYDDLVMSGRFTNFVAKASILEKYKSKEDIDFDAIVCANDVMASGVMEAFNLLDVRCPEDVIIVGFDDAIFASLSSPKLTTVNQNIANQGVTCGRLIYEILEGKTPDKVTYTDLELIIRQSCGCISTSDQNPVYINAEGKIQEEVHNRKELLSLYMEEVQEKRKYSSLIDSINDSNTIKQFFFNIKNVLNVMHLRSMALCLYDEPAYFTICDSYEIPQKANVWIYADKYEDQFVFKPDVSFNTHETVFPFDRFENKKTKEYANSFGNYIVYPIFAGEVNYGYLVCSPQKDNFSSYTVNFMILISAIAQAVEYTRSINQTEQLVNENNELIESNTHLVEQSRTDELTKVLNRRGFLELGQHLIDVIQELNVPGTVFFVDMDGLKTINDTYGHEMGDKAIRLQAEVLRKAFRSNDIIGRLGGDEFGIVANGMKVSSAAQMRDKINKLNKIVSEENKLPFELSVSFGATDLEASSVLSKLLGEADVLLYEEKKLKKENRMKKKKSDKKLKSDKN